MGDLYRELAKASTIWRAWSVVSENGRASRSPRTKAEVAEFAANAPKHISGIAWHLAHHSFRFAPAHGVAVLKKNGIDKRPIVMAPIPNRIVQRAILDVVQSIPAIKRKLNRRHNFGGIKDGGVPDAVKAAYIASRQHGYFIRTDIKGFFDNIPREVAIAKIAAEIDDAAFSEMLTLATNTELDNLVLLGRDSELFPLEDIGVAQGSALSPLLCNLLLDEFDEAMNARGIVCIRYIDDFILFARDEAKAFAAFHGAQRRLKQLSGTLECYHPVTAPGKAEAGSTDSPFQFLGCEISPDKVRPSRKSCTHLMERVQTVMANTLSASGNARLAILNHQSYAESLIAMGNIVRGWGNTYSFCTDDRLMRDLDRNITQKLGPFRGQFFNLVNKCNEQDQRRLLGVFLLEDCNRDDAIRELVKKLAPPRTTSGRRPVTAIAA